MIKSITKIILLIFFFLPFIGNSQCHYTIDMQDSYGDGWNGASVDVDINGVPITSFGFTNGNNSTDSVFTMNGDIVEFNFVSGNWDTEITFQVYDPSGVQILNIGPFATNDGNDGFLLTDTSSSTCLPQNVSVTFRVDMNNTVATFTTPEINGDWNSYCGNCDVLSDPDGDNIWETTLTLLSGSYEYYFSADNLQVQETLNSSEICTNGDPNSTRRLISVSNQNIILPVVCWNSCSQCNDFPQPPTGVPCNSGVPSLAFTDDCEQQGNWTGDFGTGNGIWQVNSGGTASGGTGPDAAHNGNSYFYYESSTFGGGGASQFDTATIISPQIDLTNAVDGAELSFWVHARGSSMGTLSVGLSNSSSGPFSNVYNQLGETHLAANSPWSQIGIDLSSYLGQNVYASFTYTRLPQANPTYTGDLAIDLLEVITCSSCPSPSNITSNNITSSSADINWTSNGTESQWEINYNGNSIVTSSFPLTLNNLNPNTTYNVTVSAICSSTNQSPTPYSATFTTLCNSEIAPYIEDFDNGISNCWSQELAADDFDWTLNTGPTPSNGFGTGPTDDVTGGGNYIYTEASNPRDPGDIAVIYSSFIDVSNLNSPELNFYYHMFGPNMGTLEIEVFDGNSFTNIFTLTGDQGDVWFQNSIPIVTSSNIIQFKIIGEIGGNWSGDIAIDNFEVREAPTCPTPTNLAFSNVTPNSVVLDWVPGNNVSSWIVNYNGNLVSTSTIPYTLSNLVADSTYNIFVTGLCANNDTSYSSNTVSVTTACPYRIAPFTENFDASFPLCWSQEINNDDFDWDLEAGGTPSANTGPSDDVSIGGNYMYTEASNPRDDGDFAIIYSESIDISGLNNPKLNFYTHMYGSAIGEIQIDMFDGNSYTPIFNKIGDQGDQWVEENVYLNTTSSYIHFRITGILSVNANGDTWPGDMAFDEFSVIEGVGDDLETINGYANSACDLSNTEIVSIEIVNPGASPQNNFDVSYSINNGSPVIETFTSTINPGDTVMYNFNTTADLSTDGVYNIDYECLLLNDQNPSNNLFSGINENFVSPNPPTTIDDTICLGDTAFLEATTNQGLINWYSDANGTAPINTNAVTPNITTTYYAEVQASNFYKDDFESYPIGSLIAQSSAFWTTLSGAGGGPFDAFISGAQMSSGNNSIYVNQLNDDDLYLLFNPLASEGIVEISMDLRIETSAHINLQDESIPASNEIFEIILSSGILEFDIGPTVLTTSYPGNNTWFNLKLEGNLASSTWNLYIDGVFVLGSYIAGADQVGSVNFRPEVGDEYYIDDVEWYVIADDDCISGLSPLTVTVEDCSSIGENNIHDLDLYPNPTSGVLNFNGTNLLEAIQVVDNHGKIVFENNINSFKGSLDLSHLSRGIYFIKGITNSGTIHKKIILN
jgi:hypothetical protein